MRATSKARKKHPLVGQAFVTWDDEGPLQQGVVTDVFDDLVQVALIDWLTGMSVTVEMWPRERLIARDPAVRATSFYEDGDERNDALEAWFANHPSFWTSVPKTRREENSSEQA